MQVERGIHHTLVEPACVDGGDPCVGRQATDVGRHVGPAPSRIARDLHVAVVGAHPDDVGVPRRLRDRVDGGVHLGRRIIHGHAAGLFLLLLLWIVGGEVGGDAVPGFAMVARAKEELRANVERALVGLAEVDGRVPVVAQLFFAVEGQRLDVARLVRLPVHAANLATLRFRVEVVGVSGVGEHPEAIATVHVLPLVAGDAARVRRRTHPRTVVLQPAVNAVRAVHVDAHVIELRDGKVVRLPPLVAAIIRIPHTAVIGGDDEVRELRIDPDVVEVAVCPTADGAEALAAIGAHDEATPRLVHLVLVLRVHDEVGEVERPPHHVLAAVARLPRPAAIVRSIEAVPGRCRFDERIDDVRIGRRNGDCHASPRLGRKARRRGGGEIGPRRATIGALEQATRTRRRLAVAAGAECPALATEIPHAGVQRLRILRVHREHGATGGQVAALQDLRPALSAIAGSIHAALVAVAPELAGHADIDRVGCRRVDDDLDDPL